MRRADVLRRSRPRDREAVPSRLVRAEIDPQQCLSGVVEQVRGLGVYERAVRLSVLIGIAQRLEAQLPPLDALRDGFPSNLGTRGLDHEEVQARLEVPIRMSAVEETVQPLARLGIQPGARKLDELEVGVLVAGRHARDPTAAVATLIGLRGHGHAAAVERLGSCPSCWSRRSATTSSIPSRDGGRSYPHRQRSWWPTRRCARRVRRPGSPARNGSRLRQRRTWQRRAGMR